MSGLGTALALIGAGAGGWVQGKQQAQRDAIAQQQADDAHKRSEADAKLRDIQLASQQLQFDRAKQIDALTGQIAGSAASGSEGTSAAGELLGSFAPADPTSGGAASASGSYDGASGAAVIPSETTAGLPPPPSRGGFRAFGYSPQSMYGDQFRLAALRGDQAGMTEAQAGMRQERMRSSVAKALSDWQSMTPMQQSQWAHDMAFDNGAGNVLVSNLNPKTGMTEVALTNDAGAVQKRVNLMPSELAQLYVTHHLDPEFSQEAMAMMSAGSKNLRDIIDHYNATTSEVAKMNNTSAYQAGEVGAAQTSAAAAMLHARAMQELYGGQALPASLQGPYQQALDDMAAAKSPEERNAAAQRANGIAASAQRMGRGGRVSMIPYLPTRGAGATEAPKVDSNGFIVKGQDVYAPDPKTGKYKKVELGDSALDRALASDTGEPATATAKPTARGLPPAPTQPFRPDPSMEVRLQSELEDMGAGRRMSFSSPEVQAYYEQKRAAQSVNDDAAEQAEARAIALQQQRRRAALGY